MIVPMKKISLLVTREKRRETLRKLRKAGIVHIQITEATGSRIDAVKEQIDLLERAVFILSEKKNKGIPQEDISEQQALETAEQIIAASETKKTCLQERQVLLNELERIGGWGEVDPAVIESLTEKGVDVQFYEMPRAVYGELDETVQTVCLEKGKNTVKFAVVRTDRDTNAENAEKLKAYRFVLPRLSTAQIKQRIDEINEDIERIDASVASYAGCKDGMKKAIAACEKKMEFEIYSAGMEREKLSAEDSREVTLAFFTGYVEEENLAHLKEIAKENAWGLLIEDPTEEDNVPTKLKNNKFVSLIYPLTDFLGTVPGYFEYDISAWFLGFILVFFGIIFGDGVYGLLITAAALALILKAKKDKKEVNPAFLLVGLFGVSTVVWGTVTCTWGGLPAENLPQWLQSLSVPFISNMYADKIWYPFWTNGEAGLTTAQNLQIFCFTLALIQLVAAHCMVAKRNRKSLKILADIGSILQLVGIYYVVLSFVVNGQVFPFGLVIGGVPVGTIALVLVIAGFVMSFVFANYNGKIGASVLESLKNIVSVLLGVVNVFSDIVSYIRLWAVGLAGAAISATVNELASPLLGNFMFAVIAVVLLVFGHGLNMILNVLSVIVHGIRLNTLEFSSHLDMSWSGHKFKPFEEN